MRLASLQYFVLFFCFFSVPALAVDWSWHLERASLYDSVVSVKQGENQLFKLEFSCDLSDALLEKPEDPASTVNIVVTALKPKGYLIVTCTVGAHSEQIVILDPFKNGDKKVFEKVGSYFAEWALEEGKIIIRYDQPCDDTAGELCEIPFSTVEKRWP